MKVAWVTPFFTSSAVGELAGRAAAELARAGHEVYLIGTGSKPYQETALPFAGIEYGRVDPAVMNAFDAVIYNISNHGSSFSIFWLLEHTPGIVILCDRVYAHMIDDYTRSFLKAPERFEAMAAQYYGEEGVDFVRRFRAREIAPEEVERFPFMEPLLTHAQCAIVHSGEFKELVASRWAGPIVQLAGFTLPQRPATPPMSREALKVGPDDFLLAFVGYITPYRSLEMLFEVLRDRPDLAARTKLLIIGRVEDPAYFNKLQQTVVAYGIAASVGWGINATDELKHSVLTRADAAYNCRLVNSEGSSASLLEEMSYGLPVIVNANGFACDAPSNAVRFVDRTRMRNDVERAIEELAGNADLRRDIGERAKAYVQRNNSTQSYAEVVAEAAALYGKKASDLRA